MITNARTREQYEQEFSNNWDRPTTRRILWAMFLFSSGIFVAVVPAKILIWYLLPSEKKQREADLAMTKPEKEPFHIRWDRAAEHYGLNPDATRGPFSMSFRELDDFEDPRFDQPF